MQDFILTAAQMRVQACQLAPDTRDEILAWINLGYANRLRYPTVTDADAAGLSGDELAAATAPSPMELAEFDGETLVVPNVNDAAEPWRAELGDWIVRSQAGKFYSVTPGEFAAQFEPVPT